MEKPSQKLLDNMERSERLLQAISSCRREIEQVLSPLTTGDRREEKNFWNQSSKYKGELKELLGIELSVEFLYSGQQFYATLESKAHCSKLIQIGLTILENQYSFDLKVALYRYLNVLGFLFDRSHQNYYICEPILKKFLNQLESFFFSLNENERLLFAKILFHGRIDGITELREYLERACNKTDIKENSELESLKNADVDNWVRCAQ